MSYMGYIGSNLATAGKKVRSTKKLILLLLVNLLLLSVVVILAVNQLSVPTDKNVDIAVYADRDVWDESVLAVRKMFEWMNYSVEYVSAKDINEIGLNKYRVFCVPGGNMYSYSQDLSPKGKENIRNFVRDGGGYLGICAGAYFACSSVVWRGSSLGMTSLGLLQCTATGPINEIAPYPNYTMCKINIVNHEHPITQSGPESHWILYYWGPAFVLDHNANATVLATYDAGNQTAVLALEYGKGKVFLIGTHPEIEEDDYRDEVTFADELDDQGSEWELLQNVLLWCAKE